MAAVLFFSHNVQDKDIARSLGGQLNLVGADVWFDEWEIRAGDSIPGKLNEALAGFETFVVLWSEHAARSSWVRAELETAISRARSDSSLRVIPVVLDETPVPALLQPLRRVDLTQGDLPQAVREIMGFQSERDRIKAIQRTLGEADIHFDYVPGYGATVGCPECGAGLDALEGWEAIDHLRDDVYAGVRCTECGWEGGGEI